MFKNLHTKELVSRIHEKDEDYTDDDKLKIMKTNMNSLKMFLDDKISIEDLKTTSEELGLPLSHKQASLMIKAFDADADGRVTLKEFSSIFNEVK